ncbi:hypothetical protein [Georgenia ruanii]|uniref:hypothetical protein n=1 Tax=Georgenia ruanii TaxID=348442 RepID=UPI00186AE141|nr:hypothetical protein [Georgenia ruanii]
MLTIATVRLAVKTPSRAGRSVRVVDGGGDDAVAAGFNASVQHLVINPVFCCLSVIPPQLNRRMLLDQQVPAGTDEAAHPKFQEKGLT